MTTRLTITNHGTSRIFAKTVDRHPDTSARRVAKDEPIEVGASVELWVHSHRELRVEEEAHEGWPEELPGGRVAFEAYRVSRGEKNHDGTPMPTWDALTDGVREGWNAAAAAVRGA